MFLKVDQIPRCGETTLILFHDTRSTLMTQTHHSSHKNLSKVCSGETPRTYRGQNLGAIDFPLGAMGGGVIRMNGKAERQWWQIFYNFEEREGTGRVPNSFFAIRSHVPGKTVVRALQTSAVEPFRGMESLELQGEYPFIWYQFDDPELPVQVSMEAYNPFIPMDMKNSAIPCGIFRVKVSNPGSQKVEVSLLGTQQNAVGFNGYDPISGPEHRTHEGYGENTNEVTKNSEFTGLDMQGAKGSLHLSVDDPHATGCASWEDLKSLFKNFNDEGGLPGLDKAQSPKPKKTIDGALSTSFHLEPGTEKIVTFVLCWHFPEGDYGRKDIPAWFFKGGGHMYENWWNNAKEVNDYVVENLPKLDDETRLFHRSLYSTNLPRYVIDRLSSNLSVLKSPTCFWTKNGYFGIWESTSNKEEWFGNCKHVLHYAQAHARLFPELGRILREIDLSTQDKKGLYPSRHGEDRNAFDGHFGTILAVYREHLLSDNRDFLRRSWPSVEKAMEFAIVNHDPNLDGMLTGHYHNTLDCDSSGTSPWIGSLYIAALKASAAMAEMVGNRDRHHRYRRLAEKASKIQNEELWNENLEYYVERPENLPNTRVMADAVGLDMFLGQWWANQLDLGMIYPKDRTLRGLRAIFEKNRITDPGEGYPPRYRDFLAKGDTGWMMFVHPGKIPDNSILYDCEVMSGFEYTASATMAQHGMVSESLEMVHEISKRYDGRLRGPGEVTTANNATVYGTGSPFGEDECGDFYARAMSSWSLLLAMQGFSYSGPEKSLGFAPVWKPEQHCSFFSCSRGWGVFLQKRDDNSQSCEIRLNYGELTLREIRLECPEGSTISSVSVSSLGQPQKCTWDSGKSGSVGLELSDEVTFQAGETIKVEISF